VSVQRGFAASVRFASSPRDRLTSWVGA
jgi:hypothetical protein